MLLFEPKRDNHNLELVSSLNEIRNKLYFLFYTILVLTNNPKFKIQKSKNQKSKNQKSKNQKSKSKQRSKIKDRNTQSNSRLRVQNANTKETVNSYNQRNNNNNNTINHSILGRYFQDMTFTASEQSQHNALHVVNADKDMVMQTPISITRKSTALDSGATKSTWGSPVENGRHCNISLKGINSTTSITKIGTKCSGVLKDVLEHLDAPINLVSVGKIIDDGPWFEIKFVNIPGNASLRLLPSHLVWGFYKDSDNTIKQQLLAYRNQNTRGLYYCTPILGGETPKLYESIGDTVQVAYDEVMSSLDTTEEDKFMAFVRKLGYPSVTKLRQLMKTTNIDGIKNLLTAKNILRYSKMPQEARIVGNLTKPIYTKTTGRGSEKHNMLYLEELHADSSQLKAKSVNGCTHSFDIVDVATGSEWSLLHKNTFTDIPLLFKRFITNIVDDARKRKLKSAGDNPCVRRVRLDGHSVQMSRHPNIVGAVEKMLLDMKPSIASDPVAPGLSRQMAIVGNSQKNKAATAKRIMREQGEGLPTWAYACAYKESAKIHDVLPQGSGRKSSFYLREGKQKKLSELDVPLFSTAYAKDLSAKGMKNKQGTDKVGVLTGRAPERNAHRVWFPREGGPPLVRAGCVFNSDFSKFPDDRITRMRKGLTVHKMTAPVLRTTTRSITKRKNNLQLQNIYSDQGEHLYNLAKMNDTLLVKPYCCILPGCKKSNPWDGMATRTGLNMHMAWHTRQALKEKDALTSIQKNKNIEQIDPKEDVDTPGGAMNTNDGVVETPGGVVETPGGVVETPGGVVETPGGVVETPGGVADTPGGDITCDAAKSTDINVNKKEIDNIDKNSNMVDDNVPNRTNKKIESIEDRAIRIQKTWKKKKVEKRKEKQKQQVKVRRSTRNRTPGGKMKKNLGKMKKDKFFKKPVTGKLKRKTKRKIAMKALLAQSADGFVGCPTEIQDIAETAVKLEPVCFTDRILSRQAKHYEQNFHMHEFSSLMDKIDKQKQLQLQQESALHSIAETPVEIQTKYDRGILVHDHDNKISRKNIICYIDVTHDDAFTNSRQAADSIQQEYDDLLETDDLSPQYDPNTPHQTLRSFMGIDDEDTDLFDHSCHLYRSTDIETAWYNMEVEGFNSGIKTKLGKDGRPVITLENCHRFTPKFSHEVKNHPFRKELFAAMEKENETLNDYNTFKYLASAPEGKRMISLRWVYKIKFRDGVFEKFKARLVGRGFTQIEGVDYDPEGTSSPVARNSTFMACIAEAAKMGYILKEFDVKSAYLLADLNEDVYAKVPFGMFIDGKTGCLKIEKSLYGLKQSGFNWFSKLSTDLKKIGFEQSDVDPCFFVLERENGDRCKICIWVDDGLVSVSSEALWQEIKGKIHAQNPLSAAGPLQFLLGMAMKQDLEAGTVTISQCSRIQALLERHQMHNCKPVKTPLPENVRITSAGRPETPLQKQEVAESCDFLNYESMVSYMREVIGACGYLSCWGRPDLRFATYFMARFQARPTKLHFQMLRRMLRYLQGTKNLCMVFDPTNSKNDLEKMRLEDEYDLYGMVDSNYTGADDTKSTTGYVFYMYGCPIVCESKKQKSTSHSTTEAELIAASVATRRCIYLRRLLQTHFGLDCKSIPIGEDNQGCIAVSRGGGSHAKMRHIRVADSYIYQEFKINKSINLRYVASEDNVSDMFTKALGPITFIRLRNRLMSSHNINKTDFNAEEY